MTKLKNFFINHRSLIIFLLLFICHIYFHFSFLTSKTLFGWDQTDSAWAVKSILIDKKILVSGPPVKGNSGFYLGPLYYYLISLVYFFTNMNPIASPIFAGLISIVSFFVVYFVTKRIFNENTALIALFINTFSYSIISNSRVEAAFTLIPTISYLIFFFLYQVIIGKIRYLIHLGIATALSFHIDFTSVFYPLIFLFSLPFFPRKKKIFRPLLFATICFFILILPVIFPFFQKHNSMNNLTNYFQTFYHGLHATRIIQLAHDAFFYFEYILRFRFFRPLVFIFLPLFFIVYYFQKKDKKRLLLSYLMILWIIVPWLVLSTYSGEITNYYFSASQDVAVAVFAYLTCFLINQKRIIFKIIPVLFWGYFAVYNFLLFFKLPYGNLIDAENSVKESIKNEKLIPYKRNNPLNYLEFYFRRK